MSTKILAFESSCDETAVALLIRDAQGAIQITHRLNSQTALHAPYGGVVPELASRDHIRHIRTLTEEVLAESGTPLEDLSAIAYTAGPGLAGALMVASAFAQALGFAYQKPLIAVHHLEGHLLSALLSEPSPPFPYVALLISGGHTQIYAVEGAGQYRLWGESLDDAAGEAFDKSAKLMGLPYPGGQALEDLARQAQNLPPPSVLRELPRPMLYSKDAMMSFSGLKTAVWHWVREVPRGQESAHYPFIAHQFQEAIAAVLCQKALGVCAQSAIRRLAICGGVAKNGYLRQVLQSACAQQKIDLFFTPMEYCTDNAAMIALAGLYHLEQARPAGAFSIDPHPAMSTLSI